MQLQEFLKPELVFADVKASGKKQLLRWLANAVEPRLGVDADATFSALMAREKLGSTGVGEGVALPHAELAGLSGIHGAFVRLEKPVAFASVDDAPVDLIFTLLAGPESATLHLRALAAVSRRLRNKDLRNGLWVAPNAEGIYALLGRTEIELP